LVNLILHSLVSSKVQFLLYALNVVKSRLDSRRGYERTVQRVIDRIYVVVFNVVSERIRKQQNSCNSIFLKFDRRNVRNHKSPPMFSWY